MIETHINDHCSGTSDHNKNGAQTAAFGVMVLDGLNVTERTTEFLASRSGQVKFLVLGHYFS